jgi:ferredoxin-NADP reductase
VAAELLFKELIVSDVCEEIPGFKTIAFEPNAIAYKPGQYLTFVHKTPHDEIRRSYSIVSTPVLNEPLAIGVKRIPNGVFSRLLVDRIKVGDALVTTGAAGFFTLPNDVELYDTLFFFAAGSGITPVYSLLKAALNLHPRLSIVLVYSSHSKQQCIFYNALVELQRQFSQRLQVEFLFADNPTLTKAHLHPDLLIQLLQANATSLDKTLHFICGPTNYMRMCWYVLQNEGVPAANLRKESFNSDKVVTKALPPDVLPHKVVIHQGVSTHQVVAQYPDTILKAAKNSGIALPYSCEVGRCGSCAAKCVKGKVWMSYNEVLTDKELSDGLVLTCVGHPVGGDVVLQL